MDLVVRRFNLEMNKEAIIQTLLIVKRRYLLMFLLLLIHLPQATYAQSLKSSNMELDKIIFDKYLLKKFVRDNFQHIKMTKIEKLEKDHPLQLLKFNRLLVNTAEKSNFSLFRLPIQDIFVLEKDNLRFCTFLIMEINSHRFDNFVEKIGYPENILKEDYQERNFDFLFWFYEDFQIFINKHHSGKKKKDSYIIQILNMPYENIMDFEKI